MLFPVDFIALKMTGEITSMVSALSEGIFWASLRTVFGAHD